MKGSVVNILKKLNSDHQFSRVSGDKAYVYSLMKYMFTFEEWQSKELNQNKLMLIKGYKYFKYVDEKHMTQFFFSDIFMCRTTDPERIGRFNDIVADILNDPNLKPATA